MAIEEFRVRLGTTAPAEARRALDQLTCDYSREVQFAARLCLDELVSNCIQYSGLPRGAEILCTVSFDQERLRVELIYDGPGFIARIKPPSEREDSGWGLALVDALSDTWGASANEGRVWYEIPVPEDDNAVARSRETGVRRH
jgi:anti-sigma regulatory factor (Ser/Thr protein kinase)